MLSVTCDAVYSRKLQNSRAQLSRAIVSHRIFSIHCHAITNLESLRIALERRGWIEKVDPNFFIKFRDLPVWQLIAKSKSGNTYERLLRSRLLENIQPDFIWDMPNSMRQNCTQRQVSNRIRHQPELNFNSKEGLVNCVRNMSKFSIKGVAELNTSRTYMLKDPVDRDAFMDDIRRTICVSLLMYIVKNDKAYALSGNIDGVWVDYAMKRVREALENNYHDWRKNLEWNTFFRNFQAIAHNHRCITWTTFSQNQIEQAGKLIEKAKTVWSHIDSDGTTNSWLLKRWNGSCGVDIHLMNDAFTMTNCVQDEKYRRYVFQKYIERPFLIYDTKFDIRQFFLLTNINNCRRIWMYKVSYLRLCSKEFSMDQLNTAIHITNYSIQKNFPVSASRCKLLPSHNMWSMAQFKNYLTSVGHPNAWDQRIYPAMTRNTIGAVLSSENSIEMPNNSFNLYGCDFLVTENLDTILLEINLSPGLIPSNQVNQYVLPMVVEDVIKVMVDNAQNVYASTGEFECVYSIPNPYQVPVINKSLQRIRPKNSIPLKPVKVKLAASLPKFINTLQKNVIRSVPLLSKFVSKPVPYKTVPFAAVKMQSPRRLKKESLNVEPKVHNFIETRFSKPLLRKGFTKSYRKFATTNQLNSLIYQKDVINEQCQDLVSQTNIKQSFANLIKKTESCNIYSGSFTEKLRHVIGNILNL